MIDIDGARVTFDDGWGLVRASNPRPALVLRFAATTEKRRKEIRGLIEGILDKLTSETQEYRPNDGLGYVRR